MSSAKWAQLVTAIVIDLRMVVAGRWMITHFGDGLQRDATIKALVRNGSGHRDSFATREPSAGESHSVGSKNSPMKATCFPALQETESVVSAIEKTITRATPHETTPEASIECSHPCETCRSLSTATVGIPSRRGLIQRQE